MRHHAPNLMAVLENRGYRTTAPRKAIAKLLEQKTIKLFLEAGVICKLLMMDGARLYSLPRVGHRHHHSVCVQCGEVGKFKADTIDRSLKAISSEIPEQIVDHHIELYVTCDDCRAAQGDQGK